MPSPQSIVAVKSAALAAVFASVLLVAGPTLYALMGGSGSTLAAAVEYSNAIFAGALAYWIKARWPKGVHCLACDHDKVYLIETKGKTKSKNKGKSKDFPRNEKAKTT